MKKKIIIGICSIAIVALFSAGYVYYSNTSSNKNVNNSENVNAVSANFSEIRLSQDELIEKSDVIVRCKFSGEKESKDSTTMTTAGNGEKISVTLPVTTYKMRLVESLKGSVENKFTVVTAGGSKYLETGDEYVLFLHDNKPESTYTLISYSQGINILKYLEQTSASKSGDQSILDSSVLADEALEIKPAESNEVMNYKELKDKIKELEK